MVKNRHSRTNGVKSNSIFDVFTKLYTQNDTKKIGIRDKNFLIFLLLNMDL